MSELGQALKEAREQKGMTLDDIQDLTKIQKRYLIAIESGDYSKLPGNFYTRAFMKSYAEAVGIDPKELFAEHLRDLPSLEHEVEVTPSRSKTHAVKTNDSKVVSALPKVVIVVALVIVLIGIWVFMQKMHAGGSGQADSPDKGVVIKNGTNLGTGKAKSKAPAAPEKNMDSTTDNQKDGTTDQNTDENSQQIKLVSTSGQVTHYTLTGTDQFVIEIDAKQGTSSWIEARNDNPKGKKLYYTFVSNGANGKKDADFKQDLADLDTLYIKTGSAPNTEIKINGKPLQLPDNGTVQKIYITHAKSKS